MTKKEQLHKELVECGKEHACKYDAKQWEIAFQDVIERVYPDRPWWETTNHFPIFTSLLSCESMADVALLPKKILANIKED